MRGGQRAPARGRSETRALKAILEDAADLTVYQLRALL